MNDTSPADRAAPPTTSPQIDTWTAALSRGEDVTIYRSRLKSFLLALLMLVIGLIGLAMALAGDLEMALVGWLLVLIGVLSTVVLLRRGFSPKPATVISDEGITVWSGSAGAVPWGQITDISLMRSAASAFVMVAVTEEERRRQSDDALSVDLDQEENGEAPTPTLWLPNGLAVNEEELVTWLEQERAARSAT